MASDMQQRGEHVSRTALKARVAGIVSAGVVVLVLVPAAEAFGRISANHNETVLAID
jgi:hypothetical protein